MKLGYTILYVEDVKKTLEFYKKAFGLKEKFFHDSGMYAELETGATVLSFASYEMALANEIGFDKNKRQKTMNDMEIAFVSSKVEEDFEKALSQGAVLVKKPTQKPWGQVVGYVRDLNGFLIEICSPVS